MVFSLHHLCNRLRVAQNVGLARGYDHDALRAKRHPGAVAGTNSSRAVENEVDSDSLEGGIGKLPALLDFAKGEGVKPDSQCRQKAIKDVHHRSSLQSLAQIMRPASPHGEGTEAPEHRKRAKNHLARLIPRTAGQKSEREIQMPFLAIAADQTVIETL